MIFLSTIVENADFLLNGLMYSIKVSCVAVVFGLFFGTILSLMSISKSRYLRIFAKVYINFFRSIPLVQVMMSLYVILPFLVKIFTGDFFRISAESSAYYSFAFFESAYFSEIIRSGIQSISRGQILASYSIGFGYIRTMRYIILPQAYRNVFPVLMTQIFIIFQDISLVYAIGAIDFFGAADNIAQREFMPTEMYIFCAVSYFFICYGFSYFSRHIGNRLNIHNQHLRR
ncbi:MULTISPECIES: amino acid ABC transporter permease [Candidatus Ichthyocystis]|uniref:Glutamate/aspartate transport system permease protein gltK n=1 Tax=Candidatus Ichthyocystis hellenicum TaxID=1561003 RepID=A0A0S4M297_9BURK|nr:MULTISPECIES: amino acid ABC transporter permease [Ichthyocystis]CUT17891.1 Glutamate/aspartate transport system permease protein gltK [Candidatus Ichthyocystis hellenicum]